MEVEFSLEFEDFKALYRWQMRQSFKQMKKKEGASWWFWPVGLVVAGVLLILKDGLTLTWSIYTAAGVSLLALLTLIGLFLCLSHVMARVALQRECLSSKQNGLFDDQRLALRSEELACISPAKAFTVKWPTIREISADENHVFFSLTERSAIVVPKRAFEDEEQFQQFGKTAERYRRASLNQAAV